MNRSIFAFALAASLLAACDADSEGGAGTGGTGGGTTGTGGSEVETAACDASYFGVEAEPTEVAIQIENQLDVAIYIPNDCYASGLDGVYVDEQSMDTWNAYHCAAAEAGTCGVFSMDCHGQQEAILEPGETTTVLWDGRLDSERMPIPPSCGLDDCDDLGVPNFGCTQLLAAAPGPHTVTVYYSLEEGPGDVSEVAVDFELPSDAVTVVIAP